MVVESIPLASNKWRFLSLYILLCLVLGWDSSLEEGMATHSSIRAWRIPWESSLVGCCPWDHRVGHNWSNSTSLSSLVSVFNFTRSAGCPLICHCGFNPWWLMGIKTYLCLLVTWIVSFVKCLLKVLLFVINLWEYHVFSGYKLFVIYTCVANILSHSMICLLNLMMMSLIEQKFLIITQYVNSLSVFSFMIIAFWGSV